MTNQELLLSIITLLVGIVAYFTKKIFDKTEIIGIDVAEIKPKVEILWKDRVAPAGSPRQLNDKGIDILNNSGIKEIVDEKKPKLLELVKAREAKNPYDAERAIGEIMRELPLHCPDIIDKLKDGAFKTGSNIEIILFVGSIYLRNEIFPELGFSLTDLDKPASSLFASTTA